MIVAVLQARFSSSRLPGKVMKQILGKPMLALQLERNLRSKMIDKLIVATSVEKDDNPIQRVCKELGVDCFRGSLNDVLDRFYLAAVPHAPSYVVRLTGDCPLVDPKVMDDTIKFAIEGDYDYASNCQGPYTFPDGLDVEVIKFSALEEAWNEAVLPSHREHVTPFVRKQPDRYSVGHYQNDYYLGHLRWTVDEPEDFELISRIYESLYPTKPTFSMVDVLQLLEASPRLSKINAHIARNEGAKPSLVADTEYLESNVAEEVTI
jgi:spore coat polysaccharide biosynthesis protein SpsF